MSFLSNFFGGGGGSGLGGLFGGSGGGGGGGIGGEGSAAIGAFGNFAGNALSSALSIYEAQRARRWARGTRSTAYQATMKDMRKAGLNPILAAKLGATPGGPVPSTPSIDFGSPGSDFFNTAQTVENTGIAEANKRKGQASAANAKRLAMAEVMGAQARAETDMLNKLIAAEQLKNVDYRNRAQLPEALRGDAIADYISTPTGKKAEAIMYYGEPVLEGLSTAIGIFNRAFGGGIQRRHSTRERRLDRRSREETEYLKEEGRNFRHFSE